MDTTSPASEELVNPPLPKIADLQASALQPSAEGGHESDLVAHREPRVALFAETRERSHPRSTSIPKEPLEQRSDATAFLLGLWPETKPGAGVPPNVQVWRDRIPAHRLSAAVREMQRGEYGNTHDTTAGWSELGTESKKKIAIAMLNAMLKQRERAGA